MDLSARGKPQDEGFDTALESVVHAAKASGKIAGILAKSPEVIGRYRSMGFTAVAYGSDLHFLKEGFNRAALQLAVEEKPGS
jgi:2-keto-3-deoxy-L-rhamnonate aldolase RhmA